MHTESIAGWQHGHTFGQDQVRSGERRTRLVIAITLTMMAVEISAGLAFGSMALLADGLHKGSHAVALGISAAAYLLARRYAADQRFTFGTGKANTLAGYTSAILLALFAVSMAWTSLGRFSNPVPIEFNLAILVAAIGLVVNAVSVWILGSGEEHGHSHDHSANIPHEHHPDRHTDHNLRSAYLHVLADALTSVLAVVALLGGKYLGWLDGPADGAGGRLPRGALVARAGPGFDARAA
jgi:cation diffusion facilitator family transporter